MDEQKNEIKRAIISTGEFRIRKEYSNLTVAPSKWFRMNKEQRQRKIIWIHESCNQREQ